MGGGAFMTGFNNLAIKRFLRSEFSRMDAPPRPILLDLGCGVSPYHALYKAFFAHCIRADFERRGPIDVRLDAVHLPFRDACFDVILMAEVLEHVALAEHALREIGRVLKPGGLLLITWPFNYMLHEIPYDYHRFTEYDMHSRLKGAGLRIELLYRRGNALVLALVLIEFFSSGVLTLFSRLPMAGKLLKRALGPVLSASFVFLYHLYLAFTWRATYWKSPAVGEGFKGMWGHLSLWHLGYCVRARKPGGTP